MWQFHCFLFYIFLWKFHMLIYLTRAYILGPVVSRLPPSHHSDGQSALSWKPQFSTTEGISWSDRVMSPAPGCIPAMLNTILNSSKPFRHHPNKAPTVQLILCLLCLQLHCQTRLNQGRCFHYIIVFLVFFILSTTLGLAFSPIDMLLHSYAWLPWTK